MAATKVINIPASVRATYSKEIIYQARPRLRFAWFAKKRQDLKQQPGGSIKFTKYTSLAQGGKLTEGVNMSAKAMSNSEISITVDEWGNATKVSEKALALSMHDELGEASILLANDMADCLDLAIMNTALSTTNHVYGGGKSTAGALTTGDVLSTSTIKDAKEALATNNAPMIDGQYYACIVHPHQIRQLTDDPNWISAHSYVGVDDIWKGELGMYDGVRFVGTTHMPANSAAVSNSLFGVNIPTWEAVMFGENSFAWAEAMEVEMRDNGVEDFGRMHGIAWYAMWGFGIIEEKNLFSLITA